MTTRRTTAAALAAGAALALGGAGTAIALANGAFADVSPSTGSSYADQSSASGGHKGGRFDGGQRMPRPQILHGELVVQDPSGTGTKTVLVQTGAVTAKTDTTVTVKSTDGFTVTWTVASTTKGTLTDVATGDTVDARGTATGNGAALAENIHEEGVGFGPGRHHGDGDGDGDGDHGTRGNQGGTSGGSKAPTVAPSPTA